MSTNRGSESGGEWRDRTVVVTGATGAVGGAIADRLIEAGATAILIGRSQPALDGLIAGHGWDASRVRGCVADLALDVEFRSVVKDLARACPEVHALVHAAGAIALGSVAESRPEDFDFQYGINVRAPYLLTQALLPALRGARGEVVFVNSSAGLHANRNGSQYGATKHALRALADSLRQEVNESDVRVLSVYLGRTASRMQAAVHEHEGRPYQPELLLQPGDVAAMVMQAMRLSRTAEVTDVHIRPMRKS